MRPSDTIIERTLSLLATIVVFTLLAGCGPAISQRALDAANRKVTFEEIKENPGKFKGEVVVLGGRIVESILGERTSKVVILEQPLSRRLRPVETDESGGRFIVEYKGFKDPAVYARGRIITVVGVVKGTETGTIGKMPYEYPLLEVMEDYLWRTGYGRTSIGIGLGVIYGN